MVRTPSRQRGLGLRLFLQRQIHRWRQEYAIAPSHPHLTQQVTSLRRSRCHIRRMDLREDNRHQSRLTHQVISRLHHSHHIHHIHPSPSRHSHPSPSHHYHLNPGPDPHRRSLSILPISFVHAANQAIRDLVSTWSGFRQGKTSSTWSLRTIGIEPRGL